MNLNHLSNFTATSDAIASNLRRYLQSQDHDCKRGDPDDGCRMCCKLDDMKNGELVEFAKAWRKNEKGWKK